MSILRFLIVSTLLLATYTDLFSQLAGKRLMDMPQKYQLPKAGDDYSPASERITGSIWQVFSDRENNQTFSSADGVSGFKKINFLDAFYVLNETADRIQIVQDPNYNIDGTLSSDAVDFGWIEKDKMLLWKHCLITSIGEIDKKAMILNTLSSIAKAKAGKSKTVRFFKNPKLSQASDDESRLFQVFYIYKMTKTAVLLGKDARISDPSYIKHDISGWVTRDRITFWDHRIALEPNWDENAVAERSRKGNKAMVFMDKTRARKYARGEQVADKFVFWNQDSYKKRNIGDWRRFPVLDRRGGVFKTGVMGEISTSTNKKISAEDNAGIQREFNKIRKKRRTINIVFAIDGTNSMSPYFASVGNAINNSMAKLKSDKNNDFRFAAIVYRDEAEGERLIETKPLTAEYQQVVSFLKSVVAKDYHDKDTPEAVNYGLKSALRQITSDKETNIVILIGDAGNHKRGGKTAVSQQKIVSILAERNCSFLAIQVHNKTDNSSYSDFVSETKEIILQTAKHRYESYKNSNPDLELNPPELVQKRANKFILNNTAGIGMGVYSPDNGQVTPALLEQEIENIVLASKEFNDKLLRLLDKIFMDGRSVKAVTKQNVKQSQATSEFVSSYTPAVVNFLSQMKKIPKQQLDVICEENYQFYMVGYTPILLRGSTHPLFKQILFLTRLELGKLMISFDELANAVSGAKRRKKMQETWIELLINHIGNIDRDELLEMTMEEVNSKVFGLPGSSRLLKEVRLADITDPAVVDDRHFDEYVQQIVAKQRDLKKIFNQDNYIYSFNSNDKMYYWISEDILP